MKYIKRILILTLVMLTLVSMASVCASDVNDTAIANEDEQQLMQETNRETMIRNNEDATLVTEDCDEIGSVDRLNICNEKTEVICINNDVGNFSELQSLVDGSGNNLELDKNYENAGPEFLISISKAITIDGKGHIIDANQRSKIFDVNIESNSVVLKNIVFKNGLQGAISFYSGSGSMTITNCTFINNSNYGRGGAIVCYSQNVLITDCTFINNTAKSSGDGGAIWFGKGGSVINSTFKNNIASSDGGALYFDVDGSGSVVNCNFINNAADNGGAIWIRSGTVTNSNFTNNKAEFNGGAIVFWFDGSVENCSFINNYLYDEAHVAGGAIYWEELNKGNVYNSRFTDCYANYGSAIYRGNWVYNSTFISCKSKEIVSSAHLYNCTFINSTVLRNEVVPDSSELINCTFIGNFDPYLTITANDIFGGNQQTITVSIAYYATGNVSVFINEINYPINMTNGFGKIVLDNLADGTYDVVVKFAGDESYVAKSINKTFNVIHNESSDTINTTNDTSYTVEPKIIASNLNTVYTSGLTFKVIVYGNNGKLASGTPVIIKVAGKIVATVKTNAGVVTYKPTQTPGTYKISATALGKTITKTLTVKHIVTLKTATVKKSAKKLVIQATLAKVNGKVLKNKKVTFKFNGKKYTAKTNAKGVAKVTIKSNVLKKLKVGKKVTYQATYLKDTVKKSVKIKK